MFPVVKRNRNKSAHSEGWVLSPHLATVPKLSQEKHCRLSAFLIVQPPLIRSFFILAHSPLQSWKPDQPHFLPFIQGPGGPTGELVTWEVYTASLQHSVRGQRPVFCVALQPASSPTQLVPKRNWERKYDLVLSLPPWVWNNHT